MTAAMTLIGSITLTSAAQSITLSSIPSTYRDIRIVLATSSTTTDGFYWAVRLNGDTGSNYSRVLMLGNGSTTSSVSNSGQTYIDIGSGNKPNALWTMDILDYAQTDKHKTLLLRSGGSVNSHAGAYRWASTSAVNTVLIGNDIGGGGTQTYGVGTTVYLYGIAG